MSNFADLILKAAAADELSHDGVARDIVRAQRRHGVDNVHQVAQPVLGDKLIVELAVKLGDLLQIPREDARLVVVERVDVDARVRLVRHDVVELAAVDTLGALDGLTQRMAAA